MSSAQKDWREELAFKRSNSSPSSGLFAPPDTTTPSEETNNRQPRPDSDIHNKEDPKPAKWERYRVRAGDVIEEDEPLLMIGKQVFASRGNVQTVSGKPKSCKTFLTSAMAGACIAGEYLGMTAPHKGRRVLMFDTEQGRSRAQNVQRRVNRMCGFPHDEECEMLFTASVRELDPAKRLEILKDAIEETKPDVVILDGVRDLLVDFNNIIESAELVNILMKLSVDYDCAIITVIHQNKGDVQARGHLGGELMNKSETAMEVVKDRGTKISTVKPVFCRNEEFEEFSFRINADALPELCDAPDDDGRDDPIAKLEKLITGAMFGTTQMLRVDLRKKLESLTGLTDRTANRKINDAISCGLLEVMPDNDKMLRLRIKLNDAPEGEDDGLPF